MASLARAFTLGECSPVQTHGQRHGSSARCVPGPVQKPWQLISVTSWQQEAATGTRVLGSMGLGGQSPPSPGPGHFPGWGKLSMGQQGHLPPLGWMPRTQQWAVPVHTLPCVPSFSPPRPGLLSPALSLHRGIHSSHCSLRCIFTLSVLVRVRSGCGRRGGQRGCLCM